MGILQKTLDQTVPKIVVERVLSDLLKRKAVAHGVHLDPAETERAAKRIAAGAKRIQLDTKGTQKLEIKLTSADFELMSKKVEVLRERMPEIVEELAERLADTLAPELTDRWHRRQSKLVRRDVAGFRKRLYERWKEPIELLRMVNTICTEVGSTLNAEASRTDLVKRTPRLFDVLRRSHARACQIASEIQALLEGGFANGAMARWRTLHEVAVVASFIAQHGEELAERYARHEAIESGKAALEYQRCAPIIGYDLLTAAELDANKRAYDSAVAQYGKSFEGSYGWAAQKLAPQNATFAAIERATKTEHLRAHYRLASHSVHANPKGVFFQLGLMRETRLLPAGPSNSGLSEPGQSTAMTLVQITTLLTTLYPTFDNVVAGRILLRLRGKVAEAFAAAEQKLSEDEAAIRRTPSAKRIDSSNRGG